MRKTCKRCKKERSLSQFYKHRQMADGHLNFCKECTKKRIASHRERNIEGIRAYDRERGKLPRRVANTVKNTRERRETLKGIGYTAAHNKVARALASGELQKPEKCSHCDKGRQIEAHHEDYNKPLEVTWLCSACHSMLHLGETPEARAIQAKIAIPLKRREGNHGYIR